MEENELDIAATHVPAVSENPIKTVFNEAKNFLGRETRTDRDIYTEKMQYIQGEVGNGADIKELIMQSATPEKTRGQYASWLREMNPKLSDVEIGEQVGASSLQIMRNQTSTFHDIKEGISDTVTSLGVAVAKIPGVYRS